LSWAIDASLAPDSAFVLGEGADGRVVLPDKAHCHRDPTGWPLVDLGGGQACVTLARVTDRHPVYADGSHGQNALAVTIADADRMLADNLGAEPQKSVNLTRGDLLTGLVDQSPAPIPG
jgi:hypothetical protein